MLLASLHATGVGINLTASHVILLEPWWNQSVEEQAMDRCHRLGQLREVRVSRYIIKDSIEEKMLRIQQRIQERSGRRLRQPGGPRGPG
jgi:DNA repair protein RAD5